MGIPRGLVSMKPTVTVSLETNILLCKRIFILTKGIVEMDFNCILVWRILGARSKMELKCSKSIRLRDFIDKFE